MRDPYTYPNSHILINKLDIRDEEELVEIEAQLFIAAIVDLENSFNVTDLFHPDSVQQIHSYLFDNLYAWAGNFRTINIYKPERVLSGLSVSYSDYQNIPFVLADIYEWAFTIKWDQREPDVVKNFTKLLVDLWRVHPFREGNTRTLSVFMKLFAEKHGISFNEQILSNHAGYFRAALALAAVEEAPEPESLGSMIQDAFGVPGAGDLVELESSSDRYQSIEQFDVEHYEEKYFSVDPLQIEPDEK
jgi:cell filamentation protein